MKLLFDQNLAPRLVEALADLFPDSLHVRNAGLASAPDAAVWDYAAKHGFTIVSKDSDFHQRSFLYGAPPKVIWVRLGNVATAEIGAALRDQAERIQDFGQELEGTFLVIP